MKRPGHTDHTKPITRGIRNQYAGLARLQGFDETFQCFERYHAGLKDHQQAGLRSREFTQQAHAPIRHKMSKSEK